MSTVIFQYQIKMSAIMFQYQIKMSEIIKMSSKPYLI